MEPYPLVALDMQSLNGGVFGCAMTDFRMHVEALEQIILRAADL